MNLSTMRSGAVAGAVSGFTFAVVHGLLISAIWFSLPILLAAGALSGLCLGWTYGLLFATPSLGSWLRFNTLFVGLFVFIAVASELVYEPVITVAEVMAGGPPSYLWGRAIPLVIVSTLTMAAIVFRLYGRTWVDFVAILLTCAVLVLLLGLNISLLGLVFVPVSSYYLIAETFGLILALNLVYVVVFASLEWRLLWVENH